MPRKFLMALAISISLLFALMSVTSAAGPADHTVPPDEVDVDLNPCTGADTTFNISYKQSVLHEFTDASGGEHFTLTASGTFVTDDGFAGRFTFWPGFNGGSGQSGVEVFTFIFSATGRNSDGQVLKFQAVANGTFIDGNPVVVFETENGVCVGKPA